MPRIQIWLNRETLEKLDELARICCDGNRSEAIRRAILFYYEVAKKKQEQG